MVIDEIYAKKGTELLPIDSIENQPIDEIIYEGQHFHFASQNDLTGTSEIVADNGVAEPIRSLEVSGNTVQNGTPTPETPCPIENANSEGMTVTVHGDNLFDQDATVSNSAFSKAEYEGYECIKITPKASAQNFSCDEIPANTVYSVSFDYVGIYGGSFGVFAIYEDGTTQYVNERGSATTNFAKFRHSKTSAKKIVGIRFSFYNVGTYKEYYFKNIMVNVGQPMDYVPYFRQEISIPANVNNGTEVELNMGKIGDYADSIVVDRIANKVIYNQNTQKKVFTGEENWVYHGILVGGNIWYRVDNTKFNAKADSSLKYGDGFCNVAKYEREDQPSTNEYFCRFSATNGNRLFVITPASANVDTVGKFKTILTELNAKGTPFTVQYVCKPITHDITNTELGQSLLELATGKGTNYLEITGHLDPSQVDLSYWQKIITNE